MEESQVSWSDLPPQLWPVIGQRLDTFIDVLRFRSVCRLWRDSLPKVKVIFPLSHPPNPNPKICGISEECLLFRRTIYRFSPLDRHQSSNSGSSSSSSSQAKGCLAMIYRTNFDKRFKLSPIYWNYKSNNERKEVNFLDFRIQEVAQSCSLGFVAQRKILAFPDSASIDVKLKKNKNICTVVTIHYMGWLFFRYYGESLRSKKWNLISGEDSHYDDAIVYKGQIYTVDRQGRVFFIDSSMKLVQICAPMIVNGDLKHLVECGGELYVVDRFVERKPGQSERFSILRYRRLAIKAVDFKVHRLDQERGRWVEVKNLGDQAFVLGVNSFSVYAPDLEGFERNCIYFVHEVNSCLSDGFNAHVFDLEKSTILKSSVRILRAPAVWLDWEAFNFKLANGNSSN